MKDPANIKGSLATTWGVPNTAGVSIPHELTFEHVSYGIDGANIIDDISLTAASGSVTCLLGPSGSGKTTLLRIAAGMHRQTKGRILLDAREVSGDRHFTPPEKRGIGLVFQDYALFPHLNIMDNVRFGLRHLDRMVREAQSTKMLGRVGLLDRASDYPHNLSGGEQQRVALARALAPRPGVLLMDEPFSGLDARLRDMMRDETLSILRETRATSVIVTHDPEEALRMGDQIALLHNGRLEQLGTGQQLYYQPQSLFAAGFFSELNVFEGQVQDKIVDTPIGKVPCETQSDGARVVVAIRTSAITASGAGAGGSSGRVLSSHFSGEHDHLRVGVSGHETPIRVRAAVGNPDASRFSPGDDVQLSVEKSGTFVFSAR